MLKFGRLSPAFMPQSISLRFCCWPVSVWLHCWHVIGWLDERVGVLCVRMREWVRMSKVEDNCLQMCCFFIRIFSSQTYCSILPLLLLANFGSLSVSESLITLVLVKFEVWSWNLQLILLGVSLTVFAFQQMQACLFIFYFIWLFFGFLFCWFGLGQSPLTSCLSLIIQYLPYQTTSTNQISSSETGLFCKFHVPGLWLASLSSIPSTERENLYLLYRSVAYLFYFMQSLNYRGMKTETNLQLVQKKST